MKPEKKNTKRVMNLFLHLALMPGVLLLAVCIATQASAQLQIEPITQSAIVLDLNKYYDEEYNVTGGPVTLGVVGAKARLDGTVIADAVNLAARVEALTRTYDVKVLLTATVVDALGDSSIPVRHVDDVAVRGRSATTAVYQLLDEAWAKTV